MSSATTHLALVKPVGGDAVTVFRTGMSANADAVDAALGRVSASLQEGVIDADAFEVTQDTGSNMNVKVASHVGTGAYVQDDAVTGQGLYYVVTTGGVTTVAIGAAHATLPRVDRVVVGLDGTVAIVAGTATSGATLDNLTGATGVPASKLLLADVHIPATDTSISNSQIRDRRKWARGAFWSATRTDNYFTTSSTLTLLDATNFNPRIECSGVPIRFAVHSSAAGFTSIGNSLILDVFIDGVALGSPKGWQVHVGGQVRMVDAGWIITPTAGSHRIGIGWASSDNSSTWTMANGVAGGPLEATVLEIEEIVRQNSANNTTTTG